MRWKNQKTWDELRWDGMTQTAVAEGCNEQFPREAAMRWDQMKWEMIQHSKGTASDWQVKSLLLRCTGALPVTYKHGLCSALYATSVSNLKLPPPACPGTTCSMFITFAPILATWQWGTTSQQMGTAIDRQTSWFRQHFLPRRYQAQCPKKAKPPAPGREDRRHHSRGELFWGWIMIGYWWFMMFNDVYWCEMMSDISRGFNVV